MYNYYYDMFMFLCNNEIGIKQNATDFDLAKATIKYALDRDTMDKEIPIDIYGDWYILQDYSIENVENFYPIHYSRITWDQIVNPDTGWIDHLSKKVDSFDQENFIKAIYHSWVLLGKP